MTDPGDVVIVGGGHNGLVCAAYLAQSGRRVLVLEAAERVGGACVTREFAPGYSVSAAAHYLNLLHDGVNRDLDLPRHGLTFAARDLDTIALAEDGSHVRISGASVTGVNAEDAAEFTRFHDRMNRFAKLLANLAVERPPKLVDGDLRDRWSLVKLAVKLRMLGRADMRELLRIGTINLFDVLEELFANDLLKGALALDGVLGSHMGPRSPNTVLGYLHRRMGEVFGYMGPAVPAGGMGAVTAALEAAAGAAGAILRTGARVRSIDVDAGRVTGVTLADGERIEARVVVSNADPKTTFRDLVGYPSIETGFARRIEHIRMRGDAAKLHLALDGLPEVAGLDRDALGQRLVVAPSLGEVERAFDHSKYGEFSAAPALEISIPTLVDPSLAPAGGHVLSAVVQYAPYALKGGWPAARDRFQELLVDRIDRHLPGIRGRVRAAELLTPVDIERQFGIHGGHWHHGELALDQLLMMRPVPGATQYATPVDGLYLCGAGAHPGGGVLGLPGRNAARAVRAQRRGRG